MSKLDDEIKNDSLSVGLLSLIQEHSAGRGSCCLSDGLIEREFGGDSRNASTTLNNLVSDDYIQAVKSACKQGRQHYRLMRKAKTLLDYGSSGDNSIAINNAFNNNTNANISTMSTNVNQQLEITPGIQERIENLKLAIQKKDASLIKKSFGYITDKSVDVAIAIMTGSLLK